MRVPQTLTLNKHLQLEMVLLCICTLIWFVMFGTTVQADKSAALTALEERSREFMREKAEKRKLEQRLHSMSSQLLMGGNAPPGWSQSRKKTSSCRRFCARLWRHIEHKQNNVCWPCTQEWKPRMHSGLLWEQNMKKFTLSMWRRWKTWRGRDSCCLRTKVRLIGKMTKLTRILLTRTRCFPARVLIHRQVCASPTNLSNLGDMYVQSTMLGVDKRAKHTNVHVALVTAAWF